ncbi:uncharacterized protein LOC120623834 [Pararge aegeria]|uniref:uncharacterized protein LOC120623834 n=1 Tax=Pararge aegeria TaxID=116150 RepID=UPI0019D292FC|nr:uncharacterized protein LOC120623834 [Pararge aegeria]
MKFLMIITCLTFFVLSEARPSVEFQNQGEPATLINTKDHARVRRRSFDYGDYMDKFWRNVYKCTNCNTLNIGNGYKNSNNVFFGEKQKERTGNNDVVNIGNGYKNTNKVYFGMNPRSQNQDPFNSPFFND